MRATDFRLGNFAQDQFGNVLMVSELFLATDREDKIVFDVLDKSKFPLPDGWQAEGIPLTKEGLVALGFYLVQDGESEPECRIKIHNFGEELVVYPESYLYQISLKNNRSFSFNRQILWVHQAQNLYFALAGAELKLCGDAENLIE